MGIKELWIDRVDNIKTDDIPTLYIGATPTETAESCRLADCPLLPISAGGTATKPDTRCYAWCGTPRMGLAAAQKSEAAGTKPHTLEYALENRSPNATAARLGALGDPIALGRVRMAEISKMIRATGLAMIAYTHGWKKARWLKRHAMASCDTPEQADRAVNAGWKAAVILPDGFAGKTARTPEGKPIVVCPAQQRPGIVTCNTCRKGKAPLCDPAAPGPIIGFIEHGPGSARRRNHANV